MYTPDIHEKVYNAMLDVYEFCDITFDMRFTNRGGLLDKGFWMQSFGVDAGMYRGYTHEISIPLFTGRNWSKKRNFICINIDRLGEIYFSIDAYGYKEASKSLIEKIYPYFGDKIKGWKETTQIVQKSDPDNPGKWIEDYRYQTVTPVQFNIGKFNPEKIKEFEDFIMEYLNSDEMKGLRKVVEELEHDDTIYYLNRNRIEIISPKKFESTMANVEKYRQAKRVRDKKETQEK